jgi:hypothetical protein
LKERKEKEERKSYQRMEGVAHMLSITAYLSQQRSIALVLRNKWLPSNETAVDYTIR